MYPQKPYLLRAFYDWIVDSHCTPYLLVDATLEGVIVPTEFIEDGEIVLNISPAAVKHLNIGNKSIDFEARFSGSPMHVIAPTKSILAIYANENGRGMVFNLDDEEDDEEDDMPPPSGGKPNLRLVE